MGVGPYQISMMEVSWKNSEWLLTIDYVRKKSHRFLNTPSLTPILFSILTCHDAEEIKLIILFCSVLNHLR